MAKKTKMQQIWDLKAKNFPRFKENQKDNLYILKFFRDCGVSFMDKNIIDIGCGNGRFALELASEARSILGIDVSPAMLEILEKDSISMGFNNIKTEACQWEDYNLTNQFDIAFASMTPALNNKEGFKKALNCSNEGLCYIGWGRTRKSEFLEEILREHNLKLDLPVGLPNVLLWLNELGYKKPPYKFVQSNLNYKSSIENAIEDIIFTIKVHDGDPNLELIKEYVSKKSSNQAVIYNQEREIGFTFIKKNK